MSDPAVTDPVDALRAVLAGLDAVPVEEHPDALEAVHAGVVAALDALAGVGTAAAATRAA